MAIVSTVVLFLVVLSILVLVHECGHFFVARLFGVRVEEFGLGFPPRAKGWKRGDTLYSLNWLPLGGFVKLKGEQGESAPDHYSFAGKNIWQRICILVAGVAMNLVLAVVLFSGGFMIGMPDIVDIGDSPWTEVKISQVVLDSPAMIAGIRAGDVIRSVNGEPIKNTNHFQSTIGQRAGQSLEIVLKRGSEMLNLLAIPRMNDSTNTAQIGVGLERMPPPHFSFPEAFLRGIKTTHVLTVTIFSFIGRALYYQEFEEFVGPVGIAVITGSAFDLGIVHVVSLMAQLSVSLAVINILPIPALDGGRVFFALVEKVRRRSLRPELENMIHVVGFILLIVLLAVVTVRDIVHLLPL